MAQYDSAVALALRLITKFGQSATLVQASRSQQTAQPWKPDTTVETSYSVKAVFLDYKINEIDGELIRRGDQRVYVPASGLAVVPGPGDHLERDEERWTVIVCVPLNPGGTQIVYTLQARRGGTVDGLTDEFGNTITDGANNFLGLE